MEYPIVICPSTLKNADKEILKNYVIKLGGQVTNNWTDQCTHLCMNSITITEKVYIMAVSIIKI